jgi:hypothetical protein
VAFLLIGAGIAQILWSRWLFPREVRRLSENTMKMGPVVRGRFLFFVETLQWPVMRMVFVSLPTLVGGLLLVAGLISFVIQF